MTIATSGRLVVIVDVVACEPESMVLPISHVAVIYLTSLSLSPSLLSIHLTGNVPPPVRLEVELELTN